MLVAGGGGVFTPLSLFASGEQGAWYDPSNLATMFEDSYGTVAVHTPGNGTADSPVGALLDSRNTNFSYLNQNTSGAGLGLNANSVLDITGDFTIEAFIRLNALPTSNSFSTSAGGYQSIFGTGPNSSTNGSDFYIGTTNIYFTTPNNSNVIINTAHGFSANTWYHVALTRQGTTFRLFIDGTLKQTVTSSNSFYTGEKWGIATSEGIGYYQGSWLNGYISNFRIVNGTAVYTASFTKPTAPLTAVANTVVLTCGVYWSGNPTIVFSSNVSLNNANPFSSVTGSHATQSTGTARPTISALYNLMQYSEQFDNAYWQKSACSITADQITAPDGTTTADKLIEDSTNSAHVIYKDVSRSAGNYTITVCVKAGTRRYFNFRSAVDVTNWCSAIFDADTSVGAYTQTQNSGSVTGSYSSTYLGNGWYRLTVAYYRSAASSASDTVIGLSNAATATLGNYGWVQYTGDGTSYGYIWGMDMRYANDGVGLPAYQRVVDANTYDSTGFPYYLYANGAGQYLRCASVDMTASNKAALFTAVRVLRDTDTQLIHDFNQAGSGCFVFYYKNPTLGATLFTGGTTQINLNSSPSGGLSSPVGKIFTATTDISAPLALIRQNGTQIASSSSSMGTGNFGNGILDLFIRGTSSYPLQARIYGHIFRGTASTATDITNTETWLNGKAKIY